MASTRSTLRPRSNSTTTWSSPPAEPCLKARSGLIDHVDGELWRLPDLRPLCRAVLKESLHPCLLHRRCFSRIRILGLAELFADITPLMSVVNRSAIRVFKKRWDLHNLNAFLWHRMSSFVSLPIYLRLADTPAHWFQVASKRSRVIILLKLSSVSTFSADSRKREAAVVKGTPRPALTNVSPMPLSACDVGTSP